MTLQAQGQALYVERQNILKKTDTSSGSVIGMFWMAGSTQMCQTKPYKEQYLTVNIFANPNIWKMPQLSESDHVFVLLAGIVPE